MQYSEDLRWAILIATLAMLMMAFFVILFVVFYQKRQLYQEKKLLEIERDHQRLLLDTALNSEEMERRRIAQALHDDIGTMLSLTKLSLNQLSKIVSESGIKEDHIMRKSQALVEETILHVRKITRDLVPTTLERFGLAAAIEEFINKLENVKSVKLLFFSNMEDSPRQTQKTELTIYRIVQELVNNSIRHAQCSKIEINLQVNREMIRLQVTDNGIGFDYEKVKENSLTGLGLLSIESRLAIVDGTISYENLKTGGSKALALVPIMPASDYKPKPLHPFGRQRLIS